MKLRTLIAASLLLAMPLVLAGCATEAEEPASTTESNAESPAIAEDFNAADVMFAQMMLPHHAQAIEMSDIILAKEDLDPRVIELADEIKAAQQPEIDQLTELLTAWDEPVNPSMDHGGMDGMMSEQDLADLNAATGDDASRLFLEQMIAHHEGAVAMAEGEIETGTNSDAIEMAEAIVATQNEEITTMQEILDSL